MQLTIPQHIEKWLDETRGQHSRAAQIIKLLHDAQEHDAYEQKNDHDPDPD